MATEGIFDVPAIVAGTPQVRSFRTVNPGYPYPYRFSLNVHNRHATATLIVTINGDKVRRVPPSVMLEVGDGTPAWYYTVDATANTLATDVSVYENGGLDSDRADREIQTVTP